MNFLRIFLRGVVGEYNRIPSNVIPEGRLRMNFIADDINLSTAIRIISLLGYLLCVELVPPNQRDPGDKRHNRETRLFFLRDFIVKCGMSIDEFAAVIGLTRDAVTYWFRQDDIRISRLYHIALSFGADLVFSITPKPEGIGEKETYPTASCTIVIQDKTPITPKLLRHPID